MLNVYIPFFSFLWPDESKFESWDERRSPLNYFIKDLCVERILDFLEMDQNARWFVEKLFYKPCTDQETIRYRLDIMDDLLASEELCIAFKDFGRSITEIKNYSTPRFKDASEVHRSAWFFKSAEAYIKSLIIIHDILLKNKLEIRSNGIKGFFNLIESIVESEVFVKMRKEAAEIGSEYENIRSIGMVIIGSDKKLTEIRFDMDDAREHCNETEALMSSIIRKSRYLCGDLLNEYCRVYNDVPFSRLEDVILEKLIYLYPQFFNRLKAFKNTFGSFPADHTFKYKNEIEFYMSMICMIKRLKKSGLGFCRPEVISSEKTVKVDGVYDLSLAIRLLSQKKDTKASDLIVCNDYMFNDEGRVFVITGPNQGGKTTFTRAVGIAQIIFQTGCHIPARSASMSPVDAIFTHFPEEELLGVKKGRLGEEVAKLSSIMEQITGNSMILLNETFSSTRRVDGCRLGRDLLKVIMSLGCYGIFVTHFNELAYEIDELNSIENMRSMLVSLIAEIKDKGNTGISGERTYAICRKKPTGLGYSRDIVMKYGLTFEQMEKLLIDRKSLFVKKVDTNE